MNQLGFDDVHKHRIYGKWNEENSKYENEAEKKTKTIIKNREYIWFSN